ncbi:thiol reductant ABC exporter subunit CydC [Vallicoccus soli]|uniref:Thiol reductant ABC exporter subunit CydC n=1 Tax=Vallicoccus soli TaxID=2339232 RepID=A0A3A3ZNB9_9ACTN|nr:thiol reductant ABC exporter subunit CydC [Vallicoccus soli]
MRRRRGRRAAPRDRGERPVSPSALLRPAARRLAIAAAVGSLALGCGVALMACSAWLISRAAQHPPVLVLSVAVVGVRAFGLGRPVLRYLERLLAHDAALRLLAGLRVRVFRAVDAGGAGGLAGRRRGDLLARLVADVDAVPDLALRVLLPAVAAAAVSLGSAALLAAVLPAAALLLLAGLGVAGVAAPALTAATARRAERSAATARADVAAAAAELVGAAPDLLVLGAGPARLDHLDRLEARLAAAERRSARWAGAGTALSQLGLAVPVAGGLLVGVPAVRTGALDPVLLALVVLVPLAVAEAVAGLPAAAVALQRARAAAARVQEVLAQERPAARPLAGPDASGAPTGVPDLLVEGATLRWPGAAAPVLRDVDLVVPAGAHVGVVGASGAGKSTLVAALLGALVPERGRVRVGGEDPAALGDAVASRLAWCGQDAHVFHTSVRENLRLAAPGAADADLEAALRAVRLLDRVRTLPAGLGTVLGEEGATLSGGERQRLALARALLSGAPVLLLDEPTAHLDVALARELTASLREAARGRTLVVVTHRAEALQGLDAVVRVDAGTVTPLTAPLAA